jgi:hypothetical protein
MERVKIGLNRYKPYVKDIFNDVKARSKRAGELIKSNLTPERVSNMIKNTSGKVASISDAIDKTLNSPIGILLRQQLPERTQIDIDRINGLNKFVGSVSKSGNTMLSGDLIGGLNKGIGGYQEYQKDYENSEERYSKYRKQRDKEMKKRNEKLLNDAKNL